MDLSVVICTWNRAELLRQTLARFGGLRRRPDTWELVVVDNRCTDHTGDVLSAFVGRLPIRVVREERAGLSHARNRGLDEARSPLIAFTDDDVLVSDGWLTACVEAAEALPGGGCFGGAVRPWFPFPPSSDLVEAFPLLARGFCGTEFESDVLTVLPMQETLVGANMAFRRIAIDGVRFDPELGRQGTKLAGQEDFVFVEEVRRRGWDAVWVPEMSVDHYVDPSRMTLRYLSRYTRDNAEQAFTAELYGAGARPLCGMPPWMIRACVQEYLRIGWFRLLGDRRRALHAHREASRLRGLLAGARRRGAGRT